MDANHLRACREHQVVGGRSDHPCPCCETGLEARPNAYDGDVIATMLQWQIEPETMLELLPKLEAEAERLDVGPAFVSVAELPRVELPAGWQPPERFFNVVGVDVKGEIRWFRTEQAARDLIKTIEGGSDAIKIPEDSDYDFDRLNPEKWSGVPEAYGSVTYDRVDNDTLRITIENFASDNAYRTARREVGQIAESWDLSVHTVEAGGRYSTGVIEVSIDD